MTDTLQILPVDRETIYLALGLSSFDFEDNIVIACAQQAHLDIIVTRDRQGFAHSPIPVMWADQPLFPVPSSEP